MPACSWHSGQPYCTPASIQPVAPPVSLCSLQPISTCSTTLHWQPIRLVISIARQEETFYSRTKPSQRRHLRPSAAKTLIITHNTDFRFSEDFIVASALSHYSPSPTLSRPCSHLRHANTATDWFTYSPTKFYNAWQTRGDSTLIPLFNTAISAYTNKSNLVFYNKIMICQKHSKSETRFKTRLENVD